MFSIIVFTEIIEHINNPMMDVLRTLWTLLRPGGCIYVTTPNFGYSLLAAPSGCRVGHDLLAGAYYLLDPRDAGESHAPRQFPEALAIGENISPYRVLQALKRGRLSHVVGNVSEQDFSDRAQQRVAGSRSSRW